MELAELQIDGEKKLTDWKSPPSIRELKQDLEEAQSTHGAHVSNIRKWLDNLNITGSAVIKTPEGSSRMAPQLIRKQAEWRYSSLSEPFLSTDDIFKVKPVTWEDKQSAFQNQILLSHQFNVRIDKLSFIDEYVRTAVDEGTVITRVGWRFEEEEYEDDVPIVEYVVNPELAPMHEYLAQMREESPSEYDTDVPDELKQAHELTIENGEPIEPVILGYETQTLLRTVHNHPTVEVCDYRNVIIDPSCQGDIDKAAFVIYSFESSKAELEKDGKYKNLDKINLQTGSILAEPDHSTNDDVANFEFRDEPRKRLVVYEYWGYWDINDNGTVEPIVAAWVGNTLIRMEKNPYPDKKVPFVSVQYLPVRKSIYGQPDGALLEDNQKIVGAVTRGMIDLLGKSANGQMGVRKDALDTTNRRKFDRGQDYEFNPNVDPRQAIYMHEFANIPESAQFMLQLQNIEAESITGVKAYSQGIHSSSLGDVATSVRGALDAASKRELGILRRLAQGIVKIGRKIISMNAEFLSEEETVRVTNEEFVTVRRDSLAGDFDLQLSISTAEENDSKAQELAFILQTMGNTADPTLVRTILGEIVRLRKMPDLAKQIQDFQPEPDPMQEKAMELEVQLLEAKLQNEMAKAAYHEATAMLNAAKVGTEEVKQGNIASDTDLKNLDFVEQESGTKQERDLQLHGEQARSQAQLKMLDRQFQQEDKEQDLLKEYLMSRN